MEDLRKQQIEALDMAEKYINKLIIATETVTDELRGNTLEDSAEYMQTIIKGVNWTIQVLNRTLDVLNEKEVLMDKESVNGRMVNFSTIFETQNMEEIAKSFETDIHTYLCEFKEAIEKRKSLDK